MAFQELNSPIPEVSPSDQPDIMAYSLLRNFVAELRPQPITPGMDLWRELRFIATGECNYARWSNTLVIDRVEHTVALFGVSGEKPDGTCYQHSALRCSCSLPDHKSFRDLEEEYQPCPAKDQVIVDRTRVYREIMGSHAMGSVGRDTLMRLQFFFSK
jgi:hypothetical protein